ncbi:MAG: DUF1574 family protein, partial [Leptospiraceae bacterium]|nr:DUF1574 family protein [Leptospiraceae bacterium]
KYMRENRGSGKNIIPRENWYQRDFAALHLWAEKDKAWLFSNYEMSDRQFEFLQRLLDLSEKHGIEVVLVRSQVARPMARLLAEDEQLGKIMRRWDARLKAMIDGRDRVRYLDLTDHPRYYCNTFVDSSHMSLDCYYPMMQEVMGNYRDRHGSAAARDVVGDSR